VPRQRIALDGEMAKLVEKIAEEHNLTVPEVVRQALVREQWYRQHEAAGDKIIVQSPDQTIKEVQFVHQSYRAATTRRKRLSTSVRPAMMSQTGASLSED
jgi:hypothetical protein